MPDEWMPVCRHRGAEIARGRWLCRSPKVVISQGTVTSADCRYGCPVVDHQPTGSELPNLHPMVDDTSVLMNAAAPSDLVTIAVVTAPRTPRTVEQTLAQLRGGGFTQAIHVFEEPGTCVQPGSGTLVFTSPRKLGVWPNWYRAAETSLEMTSSPFLLLCEDDLYVRNDAALALQHAIETLPHHDWGFASLFTSWCHGEPGDARGWHARDTRRGSFGAQAYCLSRDSLKRVLRATASRREQSGHTDVIVSTVLAALGRKCYFHFPTLCDHAGHNASSIGHVHHESMQGVLFSRRGNDYVNSRAQDASHSQAARGTVPTWRLSRPWRQAQGAATHRSGWPYAVAHLAEFAAAEAPTLLEDFVEQRFVYARQPEPIAVPWVGIFHHAPSTPPWNGLPAPREYLSRPAMVASLPHLRGAIALSEHLAADLRQRLDVPVHVARLPSDSLVRQWSRESFEASPTVTQIGWCLKNTRAIYQVPHTRGSRIRILDRRSPAQVAHDRAVIRYWQQFGGPDRRERGLAVQEISRLDNASYDALLARSIVLVEYGAASASCVVTECMARKTPLLVNRHPAIVEYLGEDYPLYYESLEHAARLTFDGKAIQAGHDYLQSLDTSWLSGEYFARHVARIVKEFGTATPVAVAELVRVQGPVAVAELVRVQGPSAGRHSRDQGRLHRQQWWSAEAIRPGPRPQIVQVCPSSGACGIAVFAANVEAHLRRFGFSVRTVRALAEVHDEDVVLIQHEHGIWRHADLPRELTRVTGRRLLFFHTPGVEHLSPYVDAFGCMCPGMIGTGKPMVMLPHPGHYLPDARRDAVRRRLGYDRYHRVLVASGFLNDARQFPAAIERILPEAVRNNWLIHLMSPLHANHGQQPRFALEESRLLSLAARHPRNLWWDSSMLPPDELAARFHAADLLWCYTRVGSRPYASGVASDQYAAGTRIITQPKRQHSALYGLPNVRFAANDLDGFCAAVVEEAEAEQISRHDGAPLSWDVLTPILGNFLARYESW